MINIPQKIKVSGYDYKVERAERAFVSNGSACDGLHDFSKQEIVVACEGNAAYQQTVFLHELTHAIIQNYCEGIMSDYDEERFTEQFAKGLYQVIKDNPEIFNK